MHAVLVKVTVKDEEAGRQMLREQVVGYRPGQYVPHDIVSRVDFIFQDKQKLADAQTKARADEPHVYAQSNERWKELEEKLIALPDRVAQWETPESLPALASVMALPALNMKFVV